MKVPGTRQIDSPVGLLTLRWHGEAPTISWIAVDPSANSAEVSSVATDEALDALVSELNRYFTGEAMDFSSIPTPRGTAFQERCWAACRQIPRGETISYARLAEAAGSPGASRAAGQTMRRNPLPIIVPCHRVVASTGRLHGFSGHTDPAGDDLGRKRYLLTLEGALLASTTPGLFE